MLIVALSKLLAATSLRRGLDEQSAGAVIANGNLTGSSGGFSASYDAKDQTTSLATSLGSLEFDYRGETQFERASAGSTSFLNSTLGVTGEQTGATATAYTRDDRGGLLSMRTGGGSFYYLTDDLGSVVGLTDDSGAVVRTYAYAPFGETTSSTAAAGAPANPWRFVGAHNYYTDSTGLMKVGIRYYDPELGRWTQRDPVWNPLDPQQANRYAYVGQNPLNHLDPTGALSGECLGSIAQLVGGVVVEGLAVFSAIVTPSPVTVTAAVLGYYFVVGSAVQTSYTCGAE
jgi:RHS repeat-associated protein